MAAAGDRSWGTDELLEAGLFDFDAIGAGREIRQKVFAGAIRYGFVTDICAGADDSNLRIGDQRAGGIGDTARERRARGLSAEERREHK